MQHLNVVFATLLLTVPSFAFAMPDSAQVVSTQNSPTTACKQIEIAVGLDPSECGTKTDAELAEMMIDKGDE